MSCYRDPQLQVGKNYLYLHNLKQNIQICSTFCALFTISHVGKEINRLTAAIEVVITLYPYIAGIDFRRQNLTSKVDPRDVRLKIFIMAIEEIMT